MLGRSWKLYVLPSSVGAGSDTARSGTSCVPSLPPARLNPVRPSPVMLSSDHESVSYATLVSTESTTRSVRIVSVPPRWPAPDARTPTRTLPFTTATPLGRLPTSILRTTGFVRGSIRATVPPNSLLTQIPPAPTAMPLGPSPTGIVAATVFFLGSIRETVPSRSFATQMEPSPNAIPLGPLPTAILWTTLPPTGSMRETLLPDVLVAQRARPPKVSSFAPTSIVCTTLPLTTLIFAIVLSSVFATQTERVPNATPAGPLPTPTVCPTGC